MRIDVVARRPAHVLVGIFQRYEQVERARDADQVAAGIRLTHNTRANVADESLCLPVPVPFTKRVSSYSSNAVDISSKTNVLNVAASCASSKLVCASAPAGNAERVNCAKLGTATVELDVSDFGVAAPLVTACGVLMSDLVGMTVAKRPSAESCGANGTI